MAASDYTPIFQAAGQAWNVDPRLLQAMSIQESSGNPKATSKAGAQGLMQIIPETQQHLGITDPNDPVQSIYGAAKYMNEALGAEKTPEDALRYYHGGPDWRNSYGPESAAYAPGVTAKYKAITTPAAPAAAAQPAPDDPFTAALKSAQQQPATPTPEPAADPFTQAVTAAQKQAAQPAPTPPAAGGPVEPDEYGNTNNVQLSQTAPEGPSGTAVGNIVTAGAQGAKEGFGSPVGQTILSPEAQAWMDAKQRQGGIGGFLAGLGSTAAEDVGTVGGVLAGIPNALYRGAQGAVAQAGTELGAPQLGRDVAAIPDAFMGSPGALGHSAPTELPVADRPFIPRTAAEGNLLANFPRPTDQAAPASRVAPRDIVGQNPLTAPQPAAANANPLSSAAPSPQSVGAAASRDMSPPSVITLTPAQEQAYRSTAEGQKLLEPQQPGIADPNVYVPGVTPNAAEIEQSVNTARELKALNVSAPEVSQEAKEIAAENNEQRQKFFSGISGSDVDVANAVAARSAQAEKDLSTAFGNKKPTDAQPVVDTIKDILTNPRDSENTAVQQYVRPLLDRLTNADSTLKSDPEQLYGLREDIARMQSKAAKAETPTLDHVNGQLQQVKGALDGVIEQGAPGYKQYLDNFSSASRPIDTMQALQGHENKLYDGQNRMIYNKVQTMMRQIVDSRKAPGLNPYKSIPDETMGQLWNLRDDLRRSASAQELARTPGSDTAQTMSDVLKGVGKSGANLAVHGALLTHLGPAGNVIYTGAKNLLSAGAEARAVKKQTARGMQILHPDPSTLRNPLQEP